MNDKQEGNKMDAKRALTVRTDEPGFWRELWQQIRLIYYLVRDPDVPIYLKVLPFLGFVYLVVPFDLFADVLPFLGRLDDVTALLLTGKVFIELSPQQVVMKHMQTIRELDGYETPATAVANEDEVVEGIVINPDDIGPEDEASVNGKR